MTNTDKLKNIIEKSGMKKGKIASHLGITRYTLQKKIEGRSQFNQTEITLLCEVLNIHDLHEKETIFFADLLINNQHQNKIAKGQKL